MSERSQPAVPDETAVALARALDDAAHPHVVAVLLFGSRLVATTPDAHSAYDFVVLVDGYLPFYRAFVDAVGHPRSPRLLSALSRVLPPNVTAFDPGLEGGAMAKCMILTGAHFERALSPSAPDHFVKGRMAQSVAVVRARDARTERWIEDLLADARRDVLRWAGPRLEQPFTSAGLARQMLHVSYRGELRPEAKDRVDEVFEAQRERLEALYGETLGEAARRGQVEAVDEGLYRLADDPGFGARLANRLYFLRSKARATLRWSKHVLTFADWLTYIQRKVERRTGRDIELTDRERKYPVIFLWPRVFRVLRELPASASDAPTADGDR